MSALPVPGSDRLQPEDSRLMRWGAASIWFLTGVLVLHPFYREVGREQLAPLGLPDEVMWLTCAAEVVLAVGIVASPPTWFLMAGQVAAVTGFTLILAVVDPWLLVHPFGVLTKNVPLVALVAATWLAHREGWTARTRWILRAGAASIWITEGFFPKVLFQQPMELVVVERSGLVPVDPSLFLAALGLAQTASGVLALTLRPGPLLRWLLWAQAAALVVLPVLVSWPEPTLWVHPFGPMTKNLPILVAQLMVIRRCLR